jgi:hypothetical protein
VVILKRYVMEHFPDCTVLKFALEVEQLTTRKKSNLILNVDGTIGCAFVDLLRGSGAFTREEADEYIKGGVLNGLFVLGRSIGFIGHYLDQKRLKQSLYRHPWDDICYMCARASAPLCARARRTLLCARVSRALTTSRALPAITAATFGAIRTSRLPTNTLESVCEPTYKPM